MEDTVLLTYLTSPNPSLDCTRSSTGTNTFNAKWDPVTGLEDWTEFGYDNIMHMYGPILQQRVPAIPGSSPPLSRLDKQIFTERTFETVLDRAIMPEVSAALRIAWPLCYPSDDLSEIAEIGKGDKARRGTAEEDNRYYADWAGIRGREITSFGYKNVCPGETKLASKWSTSKEDRRRVDFISPFSQIQTYCGRQWGCRYGYIITPEELVVVRVSRESVGTGLAALRSLREASGNPSSHSRTFSADTVSSGIQAMSLDMGSNFSDDANPNIEHGPLLFRSVPWAAKGKNALTIKLALWFLHMETRNDLSVQHEYQPLRSVRYQTSMAPAIEASEAPRQPSPTRNPRNTKDQGKGAGKKKF